jgi:hypothetical protein
MDVRGDVSELPARMVELARRGPLVLSSLLSRYVVFKITQRSLSTLDWEAYAADTGLPVR